MISETKMIVYMILISIILSYFLMTIGINKNTTVNLNKIYQSLLMGSVMGLIMVLLMDLPQNMMILWTSVLLIISLILVIAIRNQTFIYENQFLKSMIEHHQMAIFMSDRILEKNISDSFIINLAKDIKKTQDKEILQMKQWLKVK